MKLFGSLIAGLASWRRRPAQDAASFYRRQDRARRGRLHAGGGYDVYARTLARHYGRHIPGNPTVVVQNMPGAASPSRCNISAPAPADGTLVVAFNPGLIAVADLARQVPVKFSTMRGSATSARISGSASPERPASELAGFPGRTNRIRQWGSAPRPIDDRMLSDLFGAKLHAVMGYPGSADKQVAIERGERRRLRPGPACRRTGCATARSRC